MADNTKLYSYTTNVLSYKLNNNANLTSKVEKT